MSKLQFIALLTPGMSSAVLFLLAWIQSNVRLSRVEALLGTAISKQSADMRDVRESLNTIHNHLMTFYTVTGKLEGRIEELSRK